MSNAYEKRLFNEYKRLMKSIKTSNDVWDKLIQRTILSTQALCFTPLNTYSQPQKKMIVRLK